MKYQMVGLLLFRNIVELNSQYYRHKHFPIYNIYEIVFCIRLLIITKALIASSLFRPLPRSFGDPEKRVCKGCAFRNLSRNRGGFPEIKRNTWCCICLRRRSCITAKVLPSERIIGWPDISSWRLICPPCRKITPWNMDEALQDSWASTIDGTTSRADFPIPKHPHRSYYWNTPKEMPGRSISLCKTFHKKGLIDLFVHDIQLRLNT